MCNHYQTNIIIASINLYLLSLLLTYCTTLISPNIGTFVCFCKRKLIRNVRLKHSNLLGLNNIKLFYFHYQVRGFINYSFNLKWFLQQQYKSHYDPVHYR